MGCASSTEAKTPRQHRKEAKATSRDAGKSDAKPAAKSDFPKPAPVVSRAVLAGSAAGILCQSDCLLLLLLNDSVDVCRMRRLSGQEGRACWNSQQW